MSLTLGKRDLLEYNAEHKVLICRECRYAIQKHALGSHLLRHKIYRAERQLLLSSIARLQLLEPEDVRALPARSPPVGALPVISGYRCTATDCANLCASLKRMRRHWSEIHGDKTPPEPFANPASLQTFFRGTKLAYFEVATPSTVNGTPPRPRSANARDRLPSTTSDNAQVGPTPHSEQGLDRRAIPPAAPRDGHFHDSPETVELETLRYFHHFTTSTCLTLPPTADAPTRQYWQLAVVSQALRRRWLMCGLLALSAAHLVTLTARPGSGDGLNPATEQSSAAAEHLHHRAATGRWAAEFDVGWTGRRASTVAVGPAEIQATKAGAQVACLLRCSRWALEAALSLGVDDAQAPFGLQLFVATVRGCVDADFALRAAVGSDNVPADAFVDVRQASDGARANHNNSSSDTPPALLERIRTLPSRMSAVVGKPDDALDFFATLGAIDALADCAVLSYAPADDDGGGFAAVWAGVSRWLARVSDHFYAMVRRGDHAALITLAHWLVLVDRAAQRSWFLRGLAERALRLVRDEFGDNDGLQALVQGLLD